ncbi:hypothetical protein ONZ51_g728 [Trametes cubensis]|uniref:Uncharacterized protein n=1 Tax=Trametes cubensis TaxID=1111947 RepID=A0AAD7U4Z3_9APHY|nr:hypothetical protein ONZ51_g728 [Trametes cubensis]
MLALTALAVALSTVSTMATPTKRASPGPWCDGLGSGAFDTSSSFTLAAYNTTGPNANSTGAPPRDGQRRRTAASWPDALVYPTASLANGTLILSGTGDALPAQAVAVQEGDSLVFSASDSANPSAGAQDYCAVQPESGLPLLAVYGDTDSFSLCQLAWENVVFYKAAPDQGYDFDSCYPVKLQIVFQ